MIKPRHFSFSVGIAREASENQLANQLTQVSYNARKTQPRAQVNLSQNP